jgi:hypothetical protein
MDLYGHRHTSNIHQFHFIYSFQDENYDVFTLHASMHFVSIIYNLPVSFLSHFRFLT